MTMVLVGISSVSELSLYFVRDQYKQQCTYRLGWYAYMWILAALDRFSACWNDLLHVWYLMISYKERYHQLTGTC